MVNVDSYVPFLIRHKLTQQQFLLLLLLYQKKLKLIKDYKASFPTGDGSMLGEYFTQDLIKRKFLLKEERNNGKTYAFILTDKFPKLFEDVNQLCEQIMFAYPPFMTTERGQLPLAVVDIREFARLCLEYVGDDPSEYREIIEDIEYGKAHQLIKFKIDKFITSKFYIRLRQMRTGKAKETSVLSNDLDDL